MRSFRFAGMGTDVHVLLPEGRTDGIVLVRDLFDDWEERLSRFRPDSELSRLNARAGEPVVASAVLFDVVSAGVAAAQATDGLFDPTLLPQLVRVGYSESFVRNRPFAAAARGAPEPGGAWRNVVLDHRLRTVVLPHTCALDLGGIAKGMSVDAALELLERGGVEAALVSAGGDLAVLGLPPDRRTWPVLIGDDEEREMVALSRGALATSGVAGRSWLQGGIPRHHLLDPRTGDPVISDLLEVTVAAGTCKLAEVAATVCFLLGSQHGRDFVVSNKLAGRLTRRDGTRSAVGPWPALIEDAA
jgi:thiamine biosynthesis lipoprotein